MSRLPYDRSVQLWKMTRRQFREGINDGSLKVAIIPTGATEQHNEHLSLNLDIVLSTFIAQRVALRLYPQALVAPSCPVGYSPYHMARKGTLTLRKETLKAYLYDVVESLATHGISAVLVVNGHGGNHALLKDELGVWQQELGLVLDEASYWMGISDDERCDILQGYRDFRDGKLDTVARQTALNHASEEETSVMLAAWPQRVRPISMQDYDRANLDYANDLSPKVEAYLEPFSREGWPAGGPNPENPRDRARQENALLASAEKGEALIEVHTRFVAGRMQAMIVAAEAGRPWPALNEK